MKKLKSSKRQTKKRQYVVTVTFIVVVFLLGLVLYAFLYLLKGQQINAQLSDNLKKLRVLEVRYFPKGETDLLYHPNTLSSQLQDRLRQGSTFHGYAGGTTTPSIEVQVLSVINRYKPRPNVDGSWGTTYRMILEEDNLCQKIHDLKIDQIWLWVDPRPGYDPNPGMEFAISSPMFQSGVQYATVATPAFCNGQDSFIIMGFDYSRPVGNAVHSFSHFLEGLIGNLQTIELFWYRFAGNTQQGFPLTERCGNVHYPPNSTVAYEYDNQTRVETFCEDWNPEGTGVKTSYNCTRWGCTDEGYFIWWLQNFPNNGNTLTYMGKLLPSWWDFIVDMDYVVPMYYWNDQFFMNRDFLNQNAIPTVSPRPDQSPFPTFTPNPTPTIVGGPVPTPTPVRCIGQCQGDPAGSSYSPGFACLGMDSLCYLCGSNGNFTVSSTACTTPTATLTPIPSQTPTPVDTTPPEGSVTNPANGALVRKNTNVTLRVRATDNVGVSSVAIYVNNTLFCTDTTPTNKIQFSCVWHSPVSANITSTIYARITDKAGNTSFTSTISVTTK